MRTESPIPGRDGAEPQGLQAIVDRLSAIEREFSDQISIVPGDYLLFNRNFGIGYKVRHGTTSHELIYQWDQKEQLVLVGIDKTIRVYDPISTDSDSGNDYVHRGVNIGAAHHIFLGENLHLKTSLTKQRWNGLLVQVQSEEDLSIEEYSTRPDVSGKDAFRTMLARRNKTTPQTTQE